MKAEVGPGAQRFRGLADQAHTFLKDLSFVRVAHGTRCAWRHLVPIRVPLLIVMVALLLVLRVAQIDELFSLSVAAVDQLRSTSSSRRLWLHPEVLRVLFFATLLGLAAWHSARTLLAFDIVRSDTTPFGWPHLLFKRLAPRALALSIIALIAAGFGRADGAFNFACAIAAIVAGLLVWFAAFLVRLIQAVDHASAEGSPDRHKREDWRSQAPLKLWVSAWIVFVLLNLFAAMFPAMLSYAAESIGPLATLLFLTSLFVVVTTPVVLLGTCARLPVFALMLIAACLIQLKEPRSHTISTTDPDTSSPTAVSDAMNHWAKTTKCEVAYFVSAEGGGIRAAAWTALVLAHLERHLGDEGFGQCLVAASGVSGGSLGLAAFVAGRKMLLESGEMPQGSTSCFRNEGLPEQLECRLGYMMTRDFLSPLIAAMFTVDQLQLLSPWPFVHDRGKALESAFSRAFEKAFPTPRGEVGPFDPAFPPSSLYADMVNGVPYRPWAPLLVFNATDVHSGKRVLQAGVDLAGKQPESGGAVQRAFDDAFPAAIDWSAKPGGSKEVSLVGAVHNSARFSYASPAGLRDDTSIQQVVDGGYFENSGATTLLDLLELYRSANVKPARKRLFVIHIRNDAGKWPERLADEATMPRNGIPASATGKVVTKTVYGEIVPPVKTLVETRGARGEYARKALSRWGDYGSDANGNPEVKPLEVQHVSIDLVGRSGGYPLPLGWRIGDCALAEMQAQLEGKGGSARNQIAKLIPGGGGPLLPVIRNLCRPTATTVIAH